MRRSVNSKLEILKEHREIGQHSRSPNVELLGTPKLAFVGQLLEPHSAMNKLNSRIPNEQGLETA